MSKIPKDLSFKKLNENQKRLSSASRKNISPGKNTQLEANKIPYDLKSTYESNKKSHSRSASLDRNSRGKKREIPSHKEVNSKITNSVNNKKGFINIQNQDELKKDNYSFNNSKSTSRINETNRNSAFNNFNKLMTESSYDNKKRINSDNFVTKSSNLTNQKKVGNAQDDISCLSKYSTTSVSNYLDRRHFETQERINQLRSEKMKTEVSELKSKPEISRRSLLIAQKISNTNENIFNRLTSPNHKIKRMNKISQVEKEMSKNKNGPDINESSHCLRRTVDDLFEWKKTVEEKNTKKRENSNKFDFCPTLVSNSEKILKESKPTYLESSVEDRLIGKGKQYKLKIQEKSKKINDELNQNIRRKSKSKEKRQSKENSIIMTKNLETDMNLTNNSLKKSKSKETIRTDRSKEKIENLLEIRRGLNLFMQGKNLPYGNYQNEVKYNLTPQSKILINNIQENYRILDQNTDYSTAKHSNMKILDWDKQYNENNNYEKKLWTENTNHNRFQNNQVKSNIRENIRNDNNDNQFNLKYQTNLENQNEFIVKSNQNQGINYLEEIKKNQSSNNPINSTNHHLINSIELDKTNVGFERNWRDNDNKRNQNDTNYQVINTTLSNISTIQKIEENNKINNFNSVNSIPTNSKRKEVLSNFKNYLQEIEIKKDEENKEIHLKRDNFLIEDNEKTLRNLEILNERLKLNEESKNFILSRMNEVGLINMNNNETQVSGIDTFKRKK